MTEKEYAAIIILTATAIQLLVMTIAFVCRLRNQEDELYQSFRPPCPSPQRKKKESE